MPPGRPKTIFRNHPSKGHWTRITVRQTVLRMVDWYMLIIRSDYTPTSMEIEKPPVSRGNWSSQGRHPLPCDVFIRVYMVPMPIFRSSALRFFAPLRRSATSPSTSVPSPHHDPSGGGDLLAWRRPEDVRHPPHTPDPTRIAAPSAAPPAVRKELPTEPTERPLTAWKRSSRAERSKVKGKETRDAQRAA